MLLTITSHRRRSLLGFWPLLAVTVAAPACTDRPALSLTIDHPAELDLGARTGSLAFELLDEQGSLVTQAKSVTLSSLATRVLLFEAIDLRQGETYRLRIQEEERSAACPDSHLAALSAPFSYSGEKSATATVYLDCADHSSLAGQLQERRLFHSATWLPDPPPMGRVIFVGGANTALDLADLGSIQLRDSIEAYAPADGGFVGIVERLSQGRAAHQAVQTADDELVVAGGFHRQIVDGESKISATPRVDRFKGSALTQPLADLARGRGLHGAALIAPDTLVVAKGALTLGLFFLKSIEIYDPRAGRSTLLLENTEGVVGALPAVVALPGGRGALIASGWRDPDKALPNDWLCLEGACPCGEAPCVEQVPGFPSGEGRTWLTATAVPCANGQSAAIYLIGGSYNPLIGPEKLFDDIYCTGSDTLGSGLTRVGRLRHERHQHTTTLVRGPGGTQRLLVAGGDGTGSFDAGRTAELIPASCSCPAAEGIQQTDIVEIPLQQSHWLHTATLLPDGTVLLAGGLSGAAEPHAERFNPAF